MTLNLFLSQLRNVKDIDRCIKTCFALLLTITPLAAQSEGITFFNPTSYASSADIPTGFYASGRPDVLEDFRDGTLDTSITASDGSVKLSELGRSVDVDDGVLDGQSGLGGGFWDFSRTFCGFGCRTVVSQSETFRFTAGSAPTAVGFVVTSIGGDGSGRPFSGPFSVTISVLEPGGESFTQTTFANLLSVDPRDATEDLFFGIYAPNGIALLGIGAGANQTMSIDHLQYGVMGVSAVPEVNAYVMLLAGLGVLGIARGRR